MGHSSSRWRAIGRKVLNRLNLRLWRYWKNRHRFRFLSGHTANCWALNADLTKY